MSQNSNNHHCADKSLGQKAAETAGLAVLGAVVGAIAGSLFGPTGSAIGAKIGAVLGGGSASGMDNSA